MNIGTGATLLFQDTLEWRKGTSIRCYQSTGLPDSRRRELEHSVNDLPVRRVKGSNSDRALGGDVHSGFERVLLATQPKVDQPEGGVRFNHCEGRGSSRALRLQVCNDSVGRRVGCNTADDRVHTNDSEGVVGDEQVFVNWYTASG